MKHTSTVGSLIQWFDEYFDEIKKHIKN